MASAPSEPRTISGRVDRAGRLIAADPELAALQMEAGSSIGSTFALPQIAAIARLARKLGIPVSRPAVAASLDHDVEMWVRAVPQGEDVSLALEGWTVRPAAPSRLATLLGGDDESSAGEEVSEWAADEELRLVSVSGALAERLPGEPDALLGQGLTRIFRLEENDAGEMPLVSALAARHGFAGQPARVRNGDPSVQLILSGDVVFGPDGEFAGFSGRASVSGEAPMQAPGAPTAIIDQALDEALRSPLDRIIECAERIAERSDGPLRSDYAAYASDISAAARHLLSVIHSMSEEAGESHRTVDLAALAAEAVVLIEAAAEARNIAIVLQSHPSLPANGEERAVIQILVNLLGNAVRHSPDGATVSLSFARSHSTVSVTVSDEGQGIDPADQQRIFERFERVTTDASGTGLGLAISRRLARSMGGDISLESAPSLGARFSLTLPAA